MKDVNKVTFLMETYQEILSGEGRKLFFFKFCDCNFLQHCRTCGLSISLTSCVFRAISRDNTTAADVELATPISDLISLPVFPSQQIDDSTDTRLSAGSSDNQVCWMVNSDLVYVLGSHAAKLFCG
jgi:hypothetical protein